MAFRVEITKTVPLIPRGNFVQWTLSGTVPPGSYVFAVYRSGAINGPWEQLAANLSNTYSYMDRFTPPTVNGSPDVYLRPNHLSVVRNFFYKIEVIGPNGQRAEVVAEESPTLAPKQRQLLRKLLRDEYLQLRKFTGVPVAILKRRNWGPRCKCVDKVSKEIVRANCTDCWGTGIVSGYWDPVLTWAKREPLQTVVQIAAEQKTDSTTAKFDMLNVPRVERDDLIVFLSENRRFVIDQQTETSLRTVTVHQTVFALELPRSHIVYRIPVDPLTIPPIL